MNKTAKHNPWNRWTEADKSVHLQLQGGSRPIVWTLNPELTGQITEEGKIYAFAGGPVESDRKAAPKHRADGKIDGRSKGVRKCGRCGQTGHNARTCRGPVKAPTPVVEATLASSGDTPKPRSIADREAAKAGMRASKKGTRKCGKCGKSGHNARTCGKSGKPTVKRARARQNTCGKCGGKGHNARTCKG